MPRTESIRIRVSPEEKERAEKIAQALGLTISDYLRQCIRRKPRQQAA
jgi:antitoxin component of RelBE/YafQ-DinJ toxin-antitoxin module